MTEKPRINLPNPPEVSVEFSNADSIGDHRDDIFFAAIETTRMPMLVTDPRQPDNPIIFANRAFLSMTGYTPEEVRGRNCRFLQGPATDPETIDRVREAIAQRREISVEVFNYRKDGSSFWNALFIAPVFNHDRELVYFFASQLDVSRRRDAEEALGQAQKMEALGQLTSGISHDFNNLLQVMSGQLDVLNLRMRKGRLDEATVRHGMDNIRAAVMRASTLTQQLLAFSRKQRLEGRIVNLNAAVEQLGELAQRAIGDDMELQFEFEPQLANCRLDPTQLEVALINVLVNARDAMAGGGRIRVCTHGVVIGTDDPQAAAGLPPGRYVSLEIVDTGHGIPAEILPHVMNPFFTTKEEGKGTGLGLSMVYGFARQSGGTVTLRSQVGRGTTVTLIFPATHEPVRGVSNPPPERGGDETVLVVDDRPEVAALSANMLRGLGYTVHVAQGAREALALVERLPAQELPDLLFTDLIMPGGMNGYALARELRARLPGLRVLLTTGYAGSEQKAASGLAPDEDYDVLNKPYRLSELARRVRGVLDAPSTVKR